MNLRIRYTKKARKFLEKSSEGEMIVTKVYSSLSSKPFRGDIESIQGSPGLFRLRVGKYRVLFTIDHTEATVRILRIGKRENVY